jgi:A nuclease of the HNH/ENDO VII superfamily with conserved WHH
VILVSSSLLHHHEDMTTMQLVPADLNNKVPHTGGASFVKRGNK